jgi:pimeloyl-ACP methyl ester carboxylesterase
MPFAEVDNVRIFFTDEGKGQPILFVHGFSCDLYDWNWQLSHFAGSYRAIAVDLRGHGRSSAPEVGYEPQRFAQDLALLIDQLDFGPVIAVGHSLGGLVVSALAVEYPRKVTALVGVDPGYLLAEQKRELVSPIMRPEPGQTMAFTQALLSSLNGPASPEHLCAWRLRRATGVPEHVLRQTVMNSYLVPAPLGLASAASTAYLQRRQCPILAFYSDPARAPIEQSLFNDHRSKTVSWEGSGHWLHQERPIEFNTIVRDWLATLRL